jgi:hypothetical protein
MNVRPFIKLFSKKRFFGAAHQSAQDARRPNRSERRATLACGEFSAAEFLFYRMINDEKLMSSSIPKSFRL